MIPADLAFALICNRTTTYFRTNAPTYMTYTERTHVTAPGLGRSQDLNRSIAVRVADNFAVMQDLPNGGSRTGQAFPIIAYFDPLSDFGYGYFANLKRVDIALQQGALYSWVLPPDDPSVNVVVPYNSYLASRYAPDSTDAAIHLLIDPTPRMKTTWNYVSEIVEDPRTHLPSHMVVRTIGSDAVISLDFQVLDGHWVITHGTFSATQHAVVFTFKVVADITFSDITFPTEPPDPRLAGTPLPSAAPSP